MPKIEESILIETDSPVEVIVKYSGDLEEVKEAGYEVEILSCNYAIITSDISLIDDLLKFRQIEYIEKSKELSIKLKKSKNSICYNKIEQDLNVKLTGKGVIVGIIDSGIDYTHMDFRNKDGTTRIKSIWDLSLNGNPPKGSTRGTVYTEEDINKALNGEIDISHIDFIGHGTAVSGICVSNGNSVEGEYTGIAPDADIVVVKVNERVFSSFAKNTDIMRAIKYIIQIGIVRNQPVVINISFGTNDGSHDGSSLFEVYIDEMCGIHKNNIVIATGKKSDIIGLSRKNLIK